MRVRYVELFGFVKVVMEVRKGANAEVDVSRHDPRNGRVGPAGADEAHGGDAGAGGGANIICVSSAHPTTMKARTVDDPLTVLGAAR